MNKSYSYVDTEGEEIVFECQTPGAVTAFVVNRGVDIPAKDIPAVISGILDTIGIDLSKVIVGKSDVDGTSVVYTGRTKTEHVDADYEPLDSVLRRLVATMTTEQVRDPHAAYIQACATAVTDAGMPVDDWYAEDGDYLDAAIELETGRTLAWTEERGWYALTASTGGHVIDVMDTLVPPPADVAAWAASITGSTPRVLEAHLFRDAEDDDRADILADLAEYRTETPDA